MHLRSLRSLRSYAKCAVIHGVGSEPAVQLLDDSDLVESIERYDRWDIRHLWDPGGRSHTRREFREWFAQKRFDAIVNLTVAPPVIQSVLEGLPSFEMDEATYNEALRSGCSGYQALFCANRSGWRLNGGDGHEDQALAIGVAREEEAGDTLHRLQADQVPCVVLSLSASLPMKRWPLERFAELADRVIQQYSCRILFAAGPSDTWTEGILEIMVHKDRASFIPPLHLLTLASLFKRCDLLIGNDTGTMHLACAVGTPVLAIFGPTDPQVFLPPATLVRSIGGIGVVCEKHGRHFQGVPRCWGESRCPCRAESCINQVAVESVTNAVHKILEQRRPRSNVYHPNTSALE